MILDGHIHLGISKEHADRTELIGQMKAAGVGGGVILSAPPACFCEISEGGSTGERLDDLFAWAKVDLELYPFYWIDPTEDDALDQVALAVDRNVAGFKVICGDHYPGDERAMPVYGAIAQSGRPILFHSGILWDGKPSAQYNRPGNFEALLEVPALRFAMAHISWPWYDELIAVYGKYHNALQRRKDLAVELFIDVTPGTPPIYRRDALTKIFTVGYHVEDNVFFGTDASLPGYKPQWASEWIDRDSGIYAELGLSEAVQRKIFSENLRRFVGDWSA